MAAVITSKQINYVHRLTVSLMQFLNASDNLTLLLSEWSANAYATGAQPTANNITDANNVLVGDLGYISTAQLNSLIGAITTVTGSVASNRGYLEAGRP